jgi:hypothetical protein
VPALLAAACLAAVGALPGCSVGTGSAGSGDAHLTVTRDFGATRVARATLTEVPSGETVLRFLERNTDFFTG